MERFNILAADVRYDDSDPDGYRAGMNRFGRSLGAQRLGGSVYEIPAGQSICPYHWEAGDEEWLIVLAGRPTIRHPGGEEELAPGDTVCFPEGPGGAHKVTNQTADMVRVLMISTLRMPAVSIYPDSDKVGVWPGDGTSLLVRRESAVDYYDRETA
jgi:uncharacterized cupin superfamily protein